MIISIYHNKEAFIKEKPRKTYFLLIFIVLTLIIILKFTYNTKTYDNYRTNGIVTCNEECLIKTYIPSTLTPELLKLNNKSVTYRILTNEVITDEANYVTYQALAIKVESKLKDQEIVTLDFYYNKQRIIVKLKDKIF